MVRVAATAVIIAALIVAAGAGYLVFLAATNPDATFDFSYHLYTPQQVYTAASLVITGCIVTIIAAVSLAVIWRRR